MTNEQTKQTVLIADHDQELTDVLAEQFRNLGLQVFTAQSTAEAVDVMNDQFPDLIVLDIELAAGNGKTFFDVLSTMEESKEIPLIALCDTGDLASIARSDSAMAYYVTKSIESWPNIEMFTYELTVLCPDAAKTLN
jgi:CheY-like chemotaxis protein